MFFIYCDGFVILKFEDAVKEVVDEVIRFRFEGEEDVYDI